MHGVIFRYLADNAKVKLSFYIYNISNTPEKARSRTYLRLSVPSPSWTLRKLCIKLLIVCLMILSRLVFGVDRNLTYPKPQIDPH